MFEPGRASRLILENPPPFPDKGCAWTRICAGRGVYHPETLWRVTLTSIVWPFWKARHQHATDIVWALQERCTLE